MNKAACRCRPVAAGRSTDEGAQNYPEPPVQATRVRERTRSPRSSFFYTQSRFCILEASFAQFFIPLKGASGRRARFLRRACCSCGRQALPGMRRAKSGDPGRPDQLRAAKPQREPSPRSVIGHHHRTTLGMHVDAREFEAMRSTFPALTAIKVAAQPGGRPWHGERTLPRDFHELKAGVSFKPKPRPVA
jgi:hypothetical protein